jgi:hypothetical protein
VVGSFMEKLHLPVCHETGVMILIGIAVSFIIKAVAVDGNNYEKMHTSFKAITVLNWQ